MKGMEKLQENLKNLPKYTLNEEQKEAIIKAIKSESKPKRRKLLSKPFFVFALMCMTLFVLFLASEDNSLINDFKKSVQPQVELNTPGAKVFKNNNYDVIGIEGKVGILVTNEQFVAEDARRGSKLMLYFWGDPMKLINKNYRVEATNVYNTTITLSEGILYTPLNSEDAHTLTSFPAFPTEGKWQLSFFLEDQLFEEFTIEVLPPFPKTEDYTLISHPMELTVGEETELIIESSMESDKEIEVKLLNEKGSIVSEHVFSQDGSYIVAGSIIYHYRGEIRFPERGTWTLMIEDEKTKPFKN